MRRKPIVISKMGTKNRYIYLAIVLFLIGGLIISLKKGIFNGYRSDHNPTTNVSISSTPTPTSLYLSTKNWKEETNNDLGISFTIPTTWKIEEDQTRKGTYWVTVNTDSKEFQAVIGGGTDDPILSEKDGFSISLVGKPVDYSDNTIMLISRYRLINISDLSYQLTAPDEKIAYKVTFQGVKPGKVAKTIIAKMSFVK